MLEVLYFYVDLPKFFYLAAKSSSPMGSQRLNQQAVGLHGSAPGLYICYGCWLGFVGLLTAGVDTSDSLACS